MKLNDIFLKEVDRAIETVIKADDSDHIYSEVDEYVITNEIAKKIADFFSAYNDFQGINGVWISGFFGSGKSHLLKILSYVLENKEYDNEKLGEIFANKVEDNPMLKGDISKSIKIPSESILFNIDQQAQITSKTETDAILKVFYKVFNDHLGYFGNQPHIAEFERWLDSEGVYESFKSEFQKNRNKDWYSDRRAYIAPKMKEATQKALAKVFNDDAEKYKTILDDYRKDLVMSVEDFSEKVANYIANKDHGFRLNFFVDEVGQFIADNTKLMLNLQTVAESLATKCKGQAWIIVTAQEDLEAVVGDDSSLGKDDFSKIQGRFKLRIPLTSANVDEVIEKRLLTKNEKARKKLLDNWNKQEANLSTILSFSESGVQFRKFKDGKDYVNKFPFIPYQFDLFQQCIRELSKHNAFQGKHASVGERSMLGVFQEVLKSSQEEDIDSLISYDHMFEGIRSTIRGEIQNAITLAERNITNELAVQILKALFLVKYYPNFKTTARNISVLMLDSSKVDLKSHEKAVQVALNLLENQTYIQRNGDAYEFLTDDEKDIENEIKNAEIDGQQITQFFNEIIFDTVIGDNRIRFAENKQDYEFTKKIDGAIVGREKELILEFLTPHSDHYGREEFYKAHTMGYNTMALFVLPEADRLIQDIRLFLKTEKYYKQNLGGNQNASIQMILMDKQRKNVDRKRQLVVNIKQSIGEADVYMNGAIHKLGSSGDGKTKVINAFQSLVKSAYPNLKMLAAGTFEEEHVKQVMRTKQDDLFGGDEKAMGEAETEVYNFILRRKKNSERTTISDVKEAFVKKPYGWYNYAILYLLGRLYKRAKLEARQDSNLLSDEDVLTNLLNNRTHNNTLFEPQVSFDQSKVRKLKELYQEVFDEACPAKEPREVANAFKEKAKLESKKLNQMVGNKTNYPFVAAIEPIADRLAQISEMEYGVLINKVKEFDDELMDHKELTLDPIMKFWNGEQKKIFDKINNFLNGDQSNFDYVGEAELQALRDIKNHETPYQGNIIREAKETMNGLLSKVKSRIEEEKKIAQENIDKAKAKISAQPDFNDLEPPEKEKILAPLVSLETKVKDQRYISTLKQYGNDAQDLVTEGYNKIQVFVSTAAEPAAQYIKRSNVKINFSKSELVTEEDVLAYVESMQKEMLRHINENRRIVI